jgi:hypothetical protein
MGVHLAFFRDELCTIWKSTDAVMMRNRQSLQGVEETGSAAGTLRMLEPDYTITLCAEDAK